MTNKENIEENQPGRIGLFVNVDFDNPDNKDHVETQVSNWEAVAKGAIGLKVYKGLGLTNKDSEGNRLGLTMKGLGQYGCLWN